MMDVESEYTSKQFVEKNVKLFILMQKVFQNENVYRKYVFWKYYP